jgi:hypothetical protein
MKKETIDIFVDEIFALYAKKGAEAFGFLYAPKKYQ